MSLSALFLNEVLCLGGCFEESSSPQIQIEPHVTPPCVRWQSIQIGCWTDGDARFSSSPERFLFSVQLTTCCSKYGLSTFTKGGNMLATDNAMDKSMDSACMPLYGHKD